MKPVALAMTSLFLVVCEVDAHECEGELRWSKEKTAFADIQVQIAGPGTLHNFIQVSGKIQVHPDLLAYVIPKVSGSVCEVRKNVGDSVEKDEILAVLQSREIAESKAYYLAALKKFHVQQALLSQEMTLRGISAKQDYLNAEWAAGQAEIDLQLAMQSLYAIGFSEQEVANLAKEKPEEMRFFAMKSPLTGRVLQRSLTQGEGIDQSTKAFTIGNFDKVCVEIQVPQSDVHFLKAGLPVEVAAACGQSTHARITQFSPSISEETRTATAFAIIENISDAWAPGQFVTAHIQTDVTKAAIVVPITALQMINGAECVFVEEGQEFIPCTVKLGKRDRQNVEILAGLAPGATYASRNTFCLKADLEKEEAEHNH